MRGIGRTPDSSVCSAEEGVLKEDIVLATSDIPGACYPLADIHGIRHTIPLTTTRTFLESDFVRNEAHHLAKQHKLYWLDFANYLLLDTRNPQVGAFIRRPPCCRMVVCDSKNRLNLANSIIQYLRLAAQRTNAYVYCGDHHVEVFSTKSIKQGDEVFADSMMYIYDLLQRTDLNMDLMEFAVTQHNMVNNPNFSNRFYKTLTERYGKNSPLHMAYELEIKRIFSGAKFVNSEAALARAKILVAIAKLNLVARMIYCSNTPTGHSQLQRFMDPMIYHNIVDVVLPPTGGIVAMIDNTRFLGLLTHKQVAEMPPAQRDDLFELARGLGYSRADFGLILRGVKISRRGFWSGDVAIPHANEAKSNE